MIPTLALPGDVAPGQLGPISRAPAWRTTSTAGIMSSAGMPSVMQKIVWIPASAASITESGAPAAGTKMQDVFAPVSRTASTTVSNTGTRPSTAVWPPLPGVIPATIGVPYSSIARLWNSPSRPVMPWTTSRVSGPMRMLTPASRGGSPGCRHGLCRGLVERLRGREARLLEERRRLGCVRSHDPHDHRHVPRLLGPGLDQASSDLVTTGDPPEDVDEDRVDLRVGEDQPHRVGHLVGSRATADVEEVRRLAAGPLDEVHGGHRQPGAVDHAADRAVELDEGQSGLA